MSLHPETVPLRKSLERWKLAHINLLEPAYNEIYPDGRLSMPVAYTGPLHLDDTPQGVT